MRPKQIGIAEPHANAINERALIMRAVEGQLNTMLAEDRRHVDAILRTAGIDPFGYARYQIGRNDSGEWVLDLVPKEQPKEQTQMLAPVVNGHPQPELEERT